jgi:UDP-N-acetylmuramoyl-tripeptide--D-alanyl-D-alanine ligase
MPRLTLAEVVRGTEGALVGGRVDTVVTGVSIDSRTCRAGDAFFAIRGAHQDGHDFIGHARIRGAVCAVATRLPPGAGMASDFPVVLVDDTTTALQRLGAAHRRRFAIPVVAITGSNGKTTTKELAATVLSARRRVLKPTASYNNQWGVPLTLLALEAEHEAAVLELGMNAFGEISALAQLCQPTVGVVTTIAPAHLEGVGSIEGVQKAKGELVEAIPHDGVVVLNADDPLVLGLAARARGPVMTYGQADGADVRLGDVALVEGGLAFRLVAGRATADVRLPLAGRHNAWHAAAAATVGLALGVPLDEAAAALALAGPVKGRLFWREAGGIRILDDTYNANPASVRAALDTLREAPGGGRRWVILGDMLELGAQSETAHREIGAWIAALPVAGLLAVGPGMRLAAEAARSAGCPEVATFASPEGAVAHALARLARGDRVLVKGSRGMRMERAVAALLAGLGATAEGSRC